MNKYFDLPDYLLNHRIENTKESGIYTIDSFYVTDGDKWQLERVPFYPYPNLKDLKEKMKVMLAQYKRGVYTVYNYKEKYDLWIAINTKGNILFKSHEFFYATTKNGKDLKFINEKQAERDSIFQEEVKIIRTIFEAESILEDFDRAKQLRELFKKKFPKSSLLAELESL